MFAIHFLSLSFHVFFLHSYPYTLSLFINLGHPVNARKSAITSIILSLGKVQSIFVICISPSSSTFLFIFKFFLPFSSFLLIFFQIYRMYTCGTYSISFTAIVYCSTIFEWWRSYWESEAAHVTSMPVSGKSSFLLSISDCPYIYQSHDYFFHLGLWPSCSYSHFASSWIIYSFSCFACFHDAFRIPMVSLQSVVGFSVRWVVKCWMGFLY